MPGNPGGPGNPFARRVGLLRSVLLDEVSEDDLCAVVRKLAKLARAGDLGAAKLLLSYTVGPPHAAPSPDDLDAHEARTLLHTHYALEQLGKELEEPDPFDLKRLSDGELATRLRRLWKQREQLSE